MRPARTAGHPTGVPPMFTSGPNRHRRTGPWVAVCLLVAGALGAARSQQPPAQPPAQPPPAQQRPTFRAGVNFVQLDAYPTANGKPVPDLSKDDFEVLEDGVPQSVATFEHVSVKPADPLEPRREPRSTAEEKALIADPHNRLFVVFLDTYHVTDPAAFHDGRIRMPGSPTEQRPREKKPLGARGIDRAIVAFLERMIGPGDLVAAMSPEMDAGRMVFSRRPERFAEWVGTAWARRFSWDDLEPEEERWAYCYPPANEGDPFGCYTGIFEEMVLRNHEMKTLRALDDTVARLGALREGRKAVLLISEGWQLYRPDQRLARMLPIVSRLGCPPDPPQTKRVLVGPDGRMQVAASDPHNGQVVDRAACDSRRQELALADDEAEYRRLLARTNRDTVTFYPIDPRGLAVFDTPIDAASPTGKGMGGAIDEMDKLRGRLETLKDIAAATDGFFSESNDFKASMKRIADDLSEYYLLGYNSTNAALDGKYRRITVRVKRPGVQVRARRGYLAPTQADVPAEAAPVEPEVRLRESALAALGTMPADLPVRLTGGFDWAAGPAAVLWVVAELGESAAREPEWKGGGEAQITVTASGGSVVASGTGTLSSSGRAFAWRAGAGALEAGDYIVRVTARPSVPGTGSIGGQVRVTLPAPSAAARAQPGTLRVLRRGPATGLAFVPTVDTKFRRVERIRVEVSIGRDEPAVTARLLDRKGQALAVPVSTSVQDVDGMRLAMVEAALAPLAPGDYVIELSVGGGASRQTLVTAIRIVP